MDVERTFKYMFNLREDQDIVALIETAIGVANLISPDKLKKHKRRIMKSLFNEGNMFAADDEELCLSDNEDGCSGLSVATSDHSADISTVPPKNNNIIKINLKGRKKAGKVSQVAAIRPPSLLVLKKNIDTAMELKLEATKRKLDQMYREEEEKKAARKIQCIVFSESKKLCGGQNNKNMKARSGTAREMIFDKMKRRRH